MAAVAELAATLGRFRVIDLTHRLEEGMPSYPTHPKFFQMRWCGMGDPAEMHQLVLGEHTGTHVDAPSHFVPEGHAARRHIDELALSGFHGRAVLMRFGPFEASSAMVTRADIEAWEGAHAPLEPDDVVLIDFQWAHRWATAPEGFSFLDGWPGLSRDAAELLRDRRVKAVGTDCVSLDPADGGEELAAHYTLLGTGVLILENLANLGAVPAESFFVALPLPIAGGTGSPVRAVALVPDR